MTFERDTQVEPATLIRYVQQNSRTHRLEGGTKLRFTLKLEKDEQRFAAVEQLLQTGKPRCPAKQPAKRAQLLNCADDKPFHCLHDGRSLSARRCRSPLQSCPPPRSKRRRCCSRYDVELVIFRNLTPNATPEEWGMEAAAAGQRLAIPDDEPSPFAPQRAAAAPRRPAFPALPPAKFKLTAIADTLRRSRNYQPLAHFGWTQPGYPRDDAQYLPINSLVPARLGAGGPDRAVARPLSAPDAGSGVRRAGRGRRATQRFVLRQSAPDAQQRAALHRFTRSSA